MRINEFNPKLTASTLNESVAQKFGQKLNLESFTIEQLHDARNKLRTKVSQFESTANFNAVHEDETVQKNKLFLDVLNLAIDEREAVMAESVVEDTIVFTEMESMVLQKVKEGLIEFADLPHELQQKAQSLDEVSDEEREILGNAGRKRKADLSALAHNIEIGKIPVADRDKWIDHIEGEYAEVLRQFSRKPTAAASDAHVAKGVISPIAQAGTKSVSKTELVPESVMFEGQEEKAELIMSARDMVDRVTGWMENTANMQAESMLELVDSIRDELGSDVSQEFESVVKPALATIYTALESSRQQLNQGVMILTGERDESQMMGQEPPAAPVEGEADLEGPVEEPADNFAADATAAGGDEAAGRMARESVEYSRRLGTLLAPKKK